MFRVKYSSEVSFQNGKIRRNTPIVPENLSDEQLDVISELKPFMNKWLRTTIDGSLEDSTILVLTKFSRSGRGLSVDFKVQAAQPVG